MGIYAKSLEGVVLQRRGDPKDPVIDDEEQEEPCEGDSCERRRSENPAIDDEEQEERPRRRSENPVIADEEQEEPRDGNSSGSQSDEEEQEDEEQEDEDQKEVKP